MKIREKSKDVNDMVDSYQTCSICTENVCHHLPILNFKINNSKSRQGNLGWCLRNVDQKYPKIKFNAECCTNRVGFTQFPQSPDDDKCRTDTTNLNHAHVDDRWWSHSMYVRNGTWWKHIVIDVAHEPKLLEWIRHPILITKIFPWVNPWFIPLFLYVFMEVFFYWQLLLLICSLGKAFRSRTNPFVKNSFFEHFFESPRS